MVSANTPQSPDPFDHLLQWIGLCGGRVVLEMDEGDDGTELVCMEGCRHQMDPDFDVPDGTAVHFRVCMTLKDAREHGIAHLAEVLGQMRSVRLTDPRDLVEGEESA